MSFPQKVRILFEKLKASGLFTSELAEKLCNLEYCRKHKLQTEFPILRHKGKSEHSADGNHRRYYPSNKYYLSIGNKEYIFTNNWFERQTKYLLLFFNNYLDNEKWTPSVRQ